MCAPHIKNKLCMPHTELGSTVVPISTVAKNIGVFFDDVISMNNHMQHICRVVDFHLHCIGRVRNLLDRKTTEMTVHAYVTSRLDNENYLLQGISDHLLSTLQRVQNAAARLITRTKKHDHIIHVLIDLHWLPIIQRLEEKLLRLTFRSLRCVVASCLTDLLIRYQPTGRYAPLTLTCWRFRAAGYTRRETNNIFSAAPRLWNNLLLAMRSTECHSSFKKQLETFLIKRAFSL